MGLTFDEMKDMLVEAGDREFFDKQQLSDKKRKAAEYILMALKLPETALDEQRKDELKKEALKKVRELKISNREYKKIYHLAASRA